jgi:hypothetical protein
MFELEDDLPPLEGDQGDELAGDDDELGELEDDDAEGDIIGEDVDLEDDDTPEGATRLAKGLLR